MRPDNVFRHLKVFVLLRRVWLRPLRSIWALLLFILCSSQAFGGKTETRPPNIIMIVGDDVGYGDIGCFGAKDIETPYIDSLASSGLKGTAFYVASPICTPSRAAFLTGCYPHRSRMEMRALTPDSWRSFDTDKLNVAQMLRESGYHTGIFGKWHLGHRAGSQPHDAGFDEFVGLYYGHNQLSQAELEEGVDLVSWPHGKEERVPLPELTQRITELAVSYIQKNKDRPFFLYVPMFAPREPHIVSEEFRGRSKRGSYGDSMEELDWAVGQILKAVNECAIKDDTIVIFFSDNGANPAYGGSNGMLKGSKGEIHEGGLRVPFLLQWPRVTPGGFELSVPTRAIDLLPTIAEVVGYQLTESAQIIDGTSRLDAWRGAPETSKTELPVFFHSAEGFLRGVRVGEYKYNAFEDVLYDLQRDPSESEGLKATHPEVVEKCRQLLKNQSDSMHSEYLEQRIANRLLNLYNSHVAGKGSRLVVVAVALLLTLLASVLIVSSRRRE